jgi:hypothetical protein
MTNPGITQLRQAAAKALTQPSAERRADPVIDAAPLPLDHPAIALCMAAYQRARRSARIRNIDEDDSRKEALAAYKAAMPALISRQNISDFIACVAYADLRGLLHASQTDHLLNIARSARFLHTARSAPAQYTVEPENGSEEHSDPARRRMAEINCRQIANLPSPRSGG